MVGAVSAAFFARDVSKEAAACGTDLTIGMDAAAATARVTVEAYRHDMAAAGRVLAQPALSVCDERETLETETDAVKIRKVRTACSLRSAAPAAASPNTCRICKLLYLHYRSFLC